MQLPSSDNGVLKHYREMAHGMTKTAQTVLLQSSIKDLQDNIFIPTRLNKVRLWHYGYTREVT
jgi:hypothetical protein